VVERLVSRGGARRRRLRRAADACRANESEATAATLLFNVAHYALRPWPWILVALASIVVFPTIDHSGRRSPTCPLGILGHDMAYAAMLTFLPTGVLGLVTASLAAAYMSTISTHLNWGSSYVVHDVWAPIREPGGRRAERVAGGRVGRMSTVVLMVLAGLLALWMEHALQAFQILLQIGAGTGLLFILRWFWWRINAWSELTAMVVSLLVAIWFQFAHATLLPGLELGSSARLVIGVAITTVAWVGVTFATRPTDERVLRRFLAVARPGGPGWRKVVADADAAGEPIAGADAPWNVPAGILAMVAGTTAVYGTLAMTGMLLYGEHTQAGMAGVLVLAAVVALVRLWPRVRGAR
jgi:solute:Na+ symporter, SSS family